MKIPSYKKGFQIRKWVCVFIGQSKCCVVTVSTELRQQHDGSCWYLLVWVGCKTISSVLTRFRCRNPFFLDLPPHGDAGLSILGTSQLPSPLMNSVTQMGLNMKLTTFITSIELQPQLSNTSELTSLEVSEELTLDEKSWILKLTPLNVAAFLRTRWGSSVNTEEAIAQRGLKSIGTALRDRFLFSS